MSSASSMSSNRPPSGESRPRARPLRQNRHPTDSTETASFRFACLRPQKRDSVDSVDSVVMSTGRSRVDESDIRKEVVERHFGLDVVPVGVMRNAARCDEREIGRSAQPGLPDPFLRSPARIKQASKRHFCDPSLAASLLGATPKMLLRDLRTFGFLFEALAEREPRCAASSRAASSLRLSSAPASAKGRRRGVSARGRRRAGRRSDGGRAGSCGRRRRSRTRRRPPPA